MNEVIRHTIIKFEFISLINFSVTDQSEKALGVLEFLVRSLRKRFVRTPKPRTLHRLKSINRNFLGQRSFLGIRVLQ